MPQYAFDHLHHETRDVDAAVAFYTRLFDATTDPPFERGGATWVRVHIGEVRVMVTNRECVDTALGRYQGYDHVGLSTDDFDATLARIEAAGVPIWMGPVTTDSGQRLVFVNGPDNVKVELLERV